MKKILLIAAIGILLRIILSSTTYHTDMQAFDISGKLVASGHVLDLYDFSSNVAVLNYPPAIYLYHGIFSFLFSILGLSKILELNVQLLLLKLPYLIFDLLTGFILLKIFETKTKSLLVFTLWMFNPINLYSTYMMGQFDIIPTFFTILSAYLVTKNKLNLAAISLGGGIAFKLFPIFLVIPLIIFGKNTKERLKLLILSIVPYVLSIIPYLPSQNFRTTALLANQSSKSLYAGIPLSGGESIILYPTFLLFFYLIIWSSGKIIDIWKLYIIPLLLFFIFTHYHPQWLIWITPLLIIDLAILRSKDSLPYILIIVSWFASLFFFDPSLTVGIFSAADPSLHEAPSIWELLRIDIDYNLSRSLIQTVFVSASLFLIYQKFSVKEK